ncbi:hypothetical protein Fmac_008057 [Flemingia macrophylla]|uniref:RING-type domain-containing protein n=1 Tax=Flemingia macrophylla TaxID=520843 RepID=A0ABD1MWC4_9FABA
MASSEVEIASSAPFGCVLRDRNHREACRESNVKGTNHAATFQRNIKNFVIDLNTCMTTTNADSKTNENNGSSSSSNNINIKQSRSSKNNHRERVCLSRSNTFNGNNDHDNNNHTNKDESSVAPMISPRHSRHLDRWAARQAREMVSNLESEAELLSLDDNETLPRTCSFTSDESSLEIRNLGASSLVQIWEKRLNKSDMSKSIMSDSASSSNGTTENSSPIAANENESENENENENANAFSVEEQCFEGPSNEESFPDWDSREQSVSPGGRSERDRVSVADIIKKLTATNQNQSPTPSVIDDNEHEGYGGSVTGSSVSSSPCRERECGGFSTQQHLEQNQRITFSLKIRGRQAFNDLLTHMENDRHREVNNLAERGAVSRFAQRGRIQAVLRLRLLQREVEANDPSRQKSIESEVNNRQPPGGSAIIMQLRERFSSGAELRTPVQTEVANPRSPQRETVNNNRQLNNSATTNQLRKDKSNQTTRGTVNHAKESTQKSVSHARIDHNTEEARPSSDAMVQETHPSSDVMVQETHPSSDVKALHHDSKETIEATTSKIDSSLNETADKAETSNQPNVMAKSRNDMTVNEAEACNRQCVEISYEETVEKVTRNQNYAESSYDDETVDEVEDIDHNCDETNYYDWISEISRPRSYWEERRQEWYREMLETDSQNEDIKKLLERKTVSSFLSSDFREKMDRLMESHRGTQTHLVNSQDLEEDSQGLMAFLQERLHSARASQEDGREAGEEEQEERRNQEEEKEHEEEEDNADEQEQEHEEESLISGSYHEIGNDYNRSSTWSYRDHETGDYFDRAVSTSPQTYQYRSFYPDSRRSPYTPHHSIEMELMYDLRGQMEQIYHEISELRKSIKGCVDMQMQLQQSMNQVVHPVKKEENKSHNRAPKKGNCCICYEMKVDSVLYRCGHMCACLKCANELLWNSGKCPICRAKIVDVVRVYVDN